VQAQTATKSELARMLGVSRQAVGDLVKRGILPEGKDGKIDVELAKVALADRVRPSGKTAQALAAEPVQPASPNTPPLDQAGDGAADPQITSFHVARTLNEAAQAQMNQIKLRQMQAELIEKDAATRGALQIARSVRDHLISRNRRLSPELAGEDSVNVIEEILNADDRVMLGNLVREFSKLLGVNLQDASV
jgi:phage terminase Nu1 subunit (DNA packaging protein)